jgi:hypothetical protein
VVLHWELNMANFMRTSALMLCHVVSYERNFLGALVGPSALTPRHLLAVGVGEHAALPRMER